jgi:hypothetical protein
MKFAVIFNWPSPCHSDELENVYFTICPIVHVILLKFMTMVGPTTY